MVLHNPEVQQNLLKEEVSVIMEEAIKEEIEGLSRCVKIHKNNLNEASAEDFYSWIRSVIFFESRARKSEYQDMRNMINVIMN